MWKGEGRIERSKNHGSKYSNKTMSEGRGYLVTQ